MHLSVVRERKSCSDAAFQHQVQSKEMADPVSSWDVVFHPWLEILLATPSKCPCCTDTLNAAGMELKFPFGAKFRRGKDKKRRSVAWNEMGSLEESQYIFSTQNSTGLYLNFFKTDIFMEFSNRLFLTSPLIPQAFPLSTTQVCQILPCQL